MNVVWIFVMIDLLPDNIGTHGTNEIVCMLINNKKRNDWESKKRNN